jgi:hypothetical protein
MDINKAMQLCFQKDISVYPVAFGSNFKIEFREGKNKPVQYQKIIPQGIKARKDVYSAIQKTYIFLINH